MSLLETEQIDDIDRREGHAIEIAVYQNGILKSIIANHYVNSLLPRSEFTVAIPAAEGHEVFTVRGEFGAELVDGYVTIPQLWLLDKTQTPIARPRPALLFLGPSDLPLTVVFESLTPRPLWRCGIWVVTLRSASTFARMLRKLDDAR